MQEIGRRGFLGWLALSGFASFVKPPENSTGSTCSTRDIVLLKTHIAGFQYHDGMKPDVIGQLENGARLALERESGNTHDQNAIAAYTPNGNHIGYIPQAQNAMLARMIDQGAVIFARIARFDRESPAWKRLEIQVFANMPAAALAEAKEAAATTLF